MSGNVNFDNVFYLQTFFQDAVVNGMLEGFSEPLPVDNVEQYKYHLLGLMEEVGELLKSDKRWKTHRNSHHDKEEKLSELADVFICCLNIAIFSGINSQELLHAVCDKIYQNEQELEKALKEKENG